MATDPALATPDELNAQLRDGAHEMMRDAVGQSVMRDRLPVGYLTPGKTLVQFWNLDFPIQGPDYSRAAVTALLTEMLSLRRLSPGAANALGLRIYTTLPAAYGRDGSVMAAMLLARCRQALAEPETWPSLLDDGELKDAYTAYKRNERGFEGVGVIFGMGMKTPGVMEDRFNKNTNLPEWLRGVTRGLTLFRDKILRRIPPGLRKIEIPSAGFNKGGKPFRISGPQVLAAYITWIIGSGALQNRTKAEAYLAELTRRGIAVQ